MKKQKVRYWVLVSGDSANPPREEVVDRSPVRSGERLEAVAHQLKRHTAARRCGGRGSSRGGSCGGRRIGARVDEPREFAVREEVTGLLREAEGRSASAKRLTEEIPADTHHRSAGPIGAAADVTRKERLFEEPNGQH